MSGAKYFSSILHPCVFINPLATILTLVKGVSPSLLFPPPLWPQTGTCVGGGNYTCVYACACAGGREGGRAGVRWCETCVRVSAHETDKSCGKSCEGQHKTAPYHLSDIGKRDLS